MTCRSSRRPWSRTCRATPAIALLKGWHNYVCVHKVAGGYPDDDTGTLFDLGDHAGAAEHPAPARTGASALSESLGEQVLRLREWADETDTGDRDDLVPGVTDRAWRQVSVTSLECLGGKCPMLAECFPEKAKAASREADVVVTNHAMLGIAASGSPGVLPEHQVIIVDEAHELTDRVTAQATSELSVATIEHAARLARRHGGVPTTDLDSASQALATVLVGLPETRFRDGLPPAARDAVASVRDATRALLTVLKPETGPNVPPEGGRKVAQATMLALYEVADRMAADPEDHRHTVLWCSRSEDRRGSVLTRLYAAPLAVNGLIRTNLLAGRSGVLTSATLELGGSFDPIARAVGLEVRPDAEPVGPTSLAGEAPAAAGRGAVARARRRQPFRLPPAGDPLPRAAPAEARPRAGDGRAARRDRGARHGGRRPDPRSVLVAPRGHRSRSRDARAARRPDPRAGRRPAAHPGRAVHRGRGHLPVRDALALAGRRRPGPDVPPRHHRPHPLPPAGRPGQLRAVRRDREGGRQRVPGRVRHARGAAPRAGCGTADPHQRGPGRRGRARPPAGDRGVRQLPHAIAAGVLAHHGPCRGHLRARSGSLRPVSLVR